MPNNATTSRKACRAKDKIKSYTPIYKDRFLGSS